jgi:hypothetical protein
MREERVRESYDRLLAIRASGDTDRSNCLTPERLQELLDRRGPDEDRLRKLDHVMGCPFCLPEFELLRSVAKATPGPTGMWVTVLAAVVTLLIGGAVVWRIEALKQNGATSGDEGGITLLSPPADARVSAPPSFAWRPVPGVSDYRVEVLTSTGDVVWQWVGKDTTMAVPAGVLPDTSADYRWAVVAESSSGEHLRSAMRRFTVSAP